MSLISQKDRQMALDAIEFYIDDMKKVGCNSAAILSYQTLRNWIELEIYKHSRDEENAQGE